MSETHQSQPDSVIKQKLSVLVRSRLLFQREIEIDRGLGKNRFNSAYLDNIIKAKKQVDLEMQKLLASATVGTLLLYLFGIGTRPTLPFMGIDFSTVSGTLVFIALFSAYTTTLAVLAFFNSQTYSALIDQVILQASENGLLDTDMIKASYEAEWLIFKALRRNFSFYAPVHIEFGGMGKFLSQLTFILMAMISVMPFIALIVAGPTLTLTYLENDIVGVATKLFSCLCSASVTLLLIVANLSFTCEVRLIADLSESS